LNEKSGSKGWAKECFGCKEMWFGLLQRRCNPWQEVDVKSASSSLTHTRRFNKEAW
jgi:hypothetical protein